MHLSQAREEAIRNKTAGEFEIIDYMDQPLKCKWIDPSAGTFQIEGTVGFSSMDDFLLKDPMVRIGGGRNGNY